MDSFFKGKPQDLDVDLTKRESTGWPLGPGNSTLAGVADFKLPAELGLLRLVVRLKGRDGQGRDIAGLVAKGEAEGGVKLQTILWTVDKPS